MSCFARHIHTVCTYIYIYGISLCLLCHIMRYHMNEWVDILLYTCGSCLHLQLEQSMHVLVYIMLIRLASPTALQDEHSPAHLL